MVDRVNSANHALFSPLRNSSIGFIDDYESGMEASASSMAEEEEDEEETMEEMPIKKQHATILGFKRPGSKNHRRMSSGNSSTDSNATSSIPPPPTKRHTIPRSEFSSPLQIIQSPANVRLSRKEDVPTPSSGYDGDTEGPLAEDVN